MKELSIISQSRLTGPRQYVYGVKCYFKLMGLTAGNYWSTLNYMTWLTDRQNDFRQYIRKNHIRADDFWTEFNMWLGEQVEGDTYILYQPLPQFRGSLSSLKTWGLSANDTRYDLSWSGKLQEGISPQDIADSINNDRPAAYMGEDVEVGDVIVLSKDGVRTAWFYDTDGFVQIRGFERQKWGNHKKEENT